MKDKKSIIFLCLIGMILGLIELLVKNYDCSKHSQSYSIISDSCVLEND